MGFGRKCGVWEMRILGLGGQTMVVGCRFGVRKGGAERMERGKLFAPVKASRALV